MADQLRDLAAGIRVLRQHLGMGARNVPRALAMVGVATGATVAAGVVVSPPGTNRGPMHLAATLAPAVIGGSATIFAAVWVADDLPRRRTMGQFFLSLAFAPLVLAAVVTGHYEYLVIVLAILFPAERDE
ncbi:unnamed protein product [Urochloa humidicola]